LSQVAGKQPRQSRFQDTSFLGLKDLHGFSEMKQPLIERLAVIGVGLIGGSFALALKRAGVVGEVVASAASRANLNAALELGSPIP
jgi:tRNA A37 threonylcarbamoyladenosine dehydratase